MASAGVQIFAFILALMGIFGATVATLLPNWKVSADMGANIITAISQMQGLWMDCTWYSTGMFSCTLKYSVLSLPAYLQTARTTMVLSCVLAALGLCLASLGLKCTRWGGGRRAKSRTAVAGGACFVLAGVLCLVPASWFTNEVIASFLDSSVPESSKFEPGGAVYVAFVSAGFLFAGGSIFCTSCPGKREGVGQDLLFPSPDKLPQLQHMRQPQLRQGPLRSEQLHQEPLQPEQLHQEPLQPEQIHQEPLQYSGSIQPPPQDSRAGYSLQDYV